MTARDRLVLMVLVVAGLLAGFWFLALSPKREEAKHLSQQIATEQQRLETARVSAESARRAKDRYDSDYAAVAALGKAVPTDDSVPSLVYQLQAAAAGSKVDFRAVKVGGSGSAAPVSATTAQQVADLAQAQKGGSSTTSSAATQVAASTLPPGAAVGTAGFPTMPFAFTFDGSFFAMQRFFDNVERLVQVRGDQLDVQGRLLTIDGFSLGAGPNGFPQVTATISATSYLLPAAEGPTGGATAQSPVASSSTSGSTTTSATVTGVK